MPVVCLLSFATQKLPDRSIEVFGALKARQFEGPTSPSLWGEKKNNDDTPLKGSQQEKTTISKAIPYLYNIYQTNNNNKKRHAQFCSMREEKKHDTPFLVQKDLQVRARQHLEAPKRGSSRGAGKPRLHDSVYSILMGVAIFWGCAPSFCGMKGRPRGHCRICWAGGASPIFCGMEGKPTGDPPMCGV